MLTPGEIPGDSSILSSGERESIDLVLRAYGDFTAHQLSLMTHRESPWLAARARARVGSMERSTEQLRDAEIYEYFDNVTSLASFDADPES